MLSDVLHATSHRAAPVEHRSPARWCERLEASDAWLPLAGISKNSGSKDDELPNAFSYAASEYNKSERSERTIDRCQHQRVLDGDRFKIW